MLGDDNKEQFTINKNKNIIDILSKKYLHD